MLDAAVFLNDGFEEIEALTVLDVLRRGNASVLSVSLTGSSRVTGSHAITVEADTLYDIFAQNGISTDIVLVLPGGPGTVHYREHAPFLDALQEHHRQGGLIAAICAAPSVLEGLGMLEGRTIVCHPSVESEIKTAKRGSKPVETDGTLTTSKGAATAMLFALAILQKIKGDTTADRVARQLLVPEIVEDYEKYYG